MRTGQWPHDPHALNRVLVKLSAAYFDRVFLSVCVVPDQRILETKCM
jgi:hypothetical protein